jgi:hypothetical protein
MNTEIAITVRNFSNAAVKRGVDTLTVMRDEYRAELMFLLERGYGDAKALNAEASQEASRGLGPCPETNLERAAWWTLGLHQVRAHHERRDPNLS